MSQRLIPDAIRRVWETLVTPLLLDATDPASQADLLAATPAYSALILIILGLLLWTSGRRLVKLSAVVCGLVLGAMAGATVGQGISGSEAAIWWMAGGAVLGAVLAVVLLRLWIGLSTAVVLGVLGPLVWMVWTGVPLPEGLDSPATPAAQTQADPDADPADAQPSGGGIRLPDLPSLPDALPRPSTSMVQGFQQTMDRGEQQVRGWWEDKSQAQKTRIYTIGGIGAAIGLALGLLAYKFFGTAQTALVGSFLLLGGYERLAIALAESMPLPLIHDGRIRIGLVALLTVIGLIVQLRLWARK